MKTATSISNRASLPDILGYDEEDRLGRDTEVFGTSGKLTEGHLNDTVELQDSYEPILSPLTAASAGEHAVRPGPSRVPRPPSAFRYRLLDNTQGEVPLSLIQKVPDSALAASTSGRWAPQLTNDGRRLLLMHPERWYEIVDFLASGAVSTKACAALLAHARVLNIGPLVERLEAQIPGVRFGHHQDSTGFSCNFTFCNVRARCDRGDKMCLTVRYHYNMTWMVQITPDELKLALTFHPAKPVAPKLIKYTLSVPLQENAPSVSETRPLGECEPSRTLMWSQLGFSLDELISESNALAADCLTVRFDCRLGNDSAKLSELTE